MSILFSHLKGFYASSIFVLFITLLCDFSEARVWLQVMPGDMLSVRAVVDSKEKCPSACIDGKKVEMTERALEEGENFPEKVYELLIPRNIQDIKINGKKIPTLPSKINKIVMIGDTGCRVSCSEQQTCNNQVEWPIKEVLSSVAKHNPDLIIHVGDYHYRECACKDEEKCGKVYGDNFATWEAEWFSPAQEILSQYPFLFMRGNHENCDRAHKGWFRYLDAYPFESGACKEFTKSWTFDASIMQFYVFDSAYSTDLNYYTNTELIKKQLTPIKQQNKPTWFLTHKPLWNLTKELIFQYEGNVANTKVFIDYFNKYKIPVVISGHAHIAQILFMANNLPTQIIVGNGGSSLHSQDQKAVQYDVGFDYVENIPSFTAEKVNNFFGFGFAVLDLPTRKFSFYSKDNKELYSVVLTKDFQWKKEKTVCSVFEVLSKEWLK